MSEKQNIDGRGTDSLGFCPKCGNPLTIRHLDGEGEIPYCEFCGEFRFRMFNTAISAIVYDPTGEHIVLIQQYGRKNNILVAGYVTQGESAETTLCREISEELGLEVTDWQFNASEYYAPSNTLMINFACKVNKSDLSGTNGEIDFAAWYTPEEARQNIYPNSLAQKFLNRWLDKQQKL